MEYSRELNYEQPNFEKSREKKFKKLTNEVRRLSQSIHSHKPLDADWKEVCSHLKRLTEIAFVETADKMKNDNDTTLWENDESDQSINESVVRLLLEEGKLNLILRLLTNFKNVEFQDEFRVLMESECNSKKIRMSVLIQLCTIYEQSLGILLFFCIQKTESLQILDSEHLVEYISNIMAKKNTAFRPNDERMSGFFVHLFSNDKRQEIVVIYYLHILSTYFDKMNFEEKLMEFIEKYQIISKSIHYIMRCHRLLSLDCLQKYVLFLSNCFGTESFSAEPELYIKASDEVTNKQTITLLCEFYKEYLDRFVKKDKSLKMKQVRGYMKQFQKLKRQA